MVAVDTNIVIRLITGDDTKQLEIATQLVENSGIWIGQTVTLETAWVLEHLYGINISEIRTSLRNLTETEGVTFESEDCVLDALALTENGVEISDALHLAFSSNSLAYFYTFDKNFHRRASKTGNPIKLLSSSS